MSQIAQLTYKALAAVGTVAFQPLITGPLLALLTYYSLIEQRDGVPIFLLNNAIHLQLGMDPQRLILALRVLVALGVLSKANRALNNWANNNWQITARSGWRWQSEIAVVTGGCSGIGKKIVEGLAAEGVRVAILDIQALPEDLDFHESIKYFHCDVTSVTSVQMAADLIRRTIGHPTILVNNAGIAELHTILDTPSEYLQKIFEVNVMSHWKLVQEFLPNMILRNKGHIVTMASLASYATMPSSVDYSVTKAGLLAFHEGLTCEIKHFYKAHGVLTTIVHPNLVRTPLTTRHWEKVRQQPTMWNAEEISDRVLQQILSRRGGGQLIIPTSLTFISTIKGWPNWMQEGVRDVVGRTTVAINRSSGYLFIGRKF